MGTKRQCEQLLSKENGNENKESVDNTIKHNLQTEMMMMMMMMMTMMMMMMINNNYKNIYTKHVYTTIIRRIQ